MKKSILALCALTALSAGAANAQSTSTTRTNSTTTTTSGATYTPVLHYDTATDPNGSSSWWDNAVMQSTTRSSTTQYDVSNKAPLEENRSMETRTYNERMNNDSMNSNGTIERSTVEQRNRTNSPTPMMRPANDGMVQPGTMNGERNNSVTPTP